MAHVFAERALDFYDLNLNDLIADNTSVGLFHSVTLHGKTYPDVLRVAFDGNTQLAWFGGTGIDVDTSGAVISGTVTGYLQQVYIGGSYVNSWGVENFSYSAVAMYNAAVTPGTADDYAVFASILSGADTFSLSSQADRVDAYAGNDLIYGNGGNDTLYGGSGNDLLNGGTGSDSMLGGSGNDSYYVDALGDLTVETSTVGSEIDRVTSSVSRTLGNNLEQLVLTGAGNLSGYGNPLANTMWGNSGANYLASYSGNDTLYGGSGNDLMVGGTGNDSMVGGTGNDTYDVDASGDATIETSTLSTEIDRVYSSVGRTLGDYLEELVLTGDDDLGGFGNERANTLWGNAGGNVLNGAGGNDTLYGGNGNDVLTGGTDNDSMVGGFGNDSYYVGASGDVTFESSTLATEIDRVYSSVNRTLGNNLEQLVLTGVSALNGYGNGLVNTIWGNAGANYLGGNGGNDTLSGGSGNDTLNGGSGTDSMVGGSGNDTYYVDSTGDIVSESSTLATEIDTVSSSVSHLLGTNVERLVLSGAAAINGYGNNLANTLSGNSANNYLSSGAGNDTLYGGAGGDLLAGGSGTDSMVGGTGNDFYYVDSGADRVVETSSAASETDSVSSSISYALGNNVERLILTDTAINGYGNTLSNLIEGNAVNNLLNGGAGNDTLNGAAGNDTVYGGTGNDVLNGGLGNDSMVGSYGNDHYYVDSSGDRSIETSTLATEIDTVIASISHALASNVERLTLTGGGNLSGVGNSLDNVLFGNTGSNYLNGSVGADRLYGGNGNDLLYGGSGNDMLTGGAGLDRFTFTTTLNATTNVDRVMDFVSADDRFELDNAVFTTIGPAGALATSAFHVGTAAADASDRVIYDATAGRLYFDADGTGASAAVLFATVDANTSINLSDFYVI